MPRLEWDKSGERFFETGVDRTVLYPAVNGAYPKGVAWNGITAVNENPSGAEPTALYADNIKYLTLMSAEEYGYTIEAYMYPDEFGQCDGSATIAEGVTIRQQKRVPFGLCYKYEDGVCVLRSEAEIAEDVANLPPPAPVEPTSAEAVQYKAALKILGIETEG